MLELKTMKITNIQKFNTKIRTIDNKLLAGNQPSYLTLMITV